MKAILIGSVGSSRTILEEMIKVKFPIDMVFSLDEQYSKNVSGYYPIHEIAENNNIPYRKFRKINDQDNIDLIKNINPDYIFIIGLSQLVGKDVIDAAKIGVIGFHPTPLPKLRGRAAMVWQVLLGVRETKCTLFFIDEGIDSGDIIGQEEYIIDDTDYAIDVSKKCQMAFERLIKRVIPQLLVGSIKPQKQNEEEATYLLKRSPEDGLIDWDLSSEKIQRLIRAVSKPYPGAFSYYDGKNKVIFWKADYMENTKYIGFPGQIANITKDFIDIVCIDGLLRVYEFENVNNVKIVLGHKFKQTNY
jgi:methionyl-tRNA formyltransferase